MQKKVLVSGKRNLGSNGTSIYSHRQIVDNYDSF